MALRAPLRPPAAAPAADAGQVNLCISQLEGMGFAREQAVRAAIKWKGNTDQAANYILSGALDVPAPAAARPTSAAPPPPPPAVLKPAGLSAKERERALASPTAAAAAAAAAPMPIAVHARASYRAAAPPAMVSTPASRQQAQYAAQQSPSARLSAALQSPKRHLVSPHSPFIPTERPFSPTGSPQSSSSSSSHASASPEPVAPRVSPKASGREYTSALVNRPPSPYRHAPTVLTPMDLTSSPLSRSQSSLQSMQLSDDPIELDHAQPTNRAAAHIKVALPVSTRHSTAATPANQPIPSSTRAKPAFPPSGYQSTLAALPSPSAPQPSASAHGRLHIIPGTPSAAAAVAGARTPMSGAFAPTPMASGPPTPLALMSQLSPVGIDPRLAATLQPFLARDMPRPRSLSEDALRSHAEQLGTHSLPLGVNSFIDVRDALGKWLEAQVIETGLIDPSKPRTLPNYRIFVRYLLWDDRWNEWITPMVDPSRISSFRSWSAGSHTESPAGDMSVPRSAPSWVRKGDFVCAWFTSDGRKRVEGWYLGKIAKVDSLQLQIDLHPQMTPAYAATLKPDEVGKKVQRWFHSSSDLVVPVTTALDMLKQHQAAAQQRSGPTPIDVATPAAADGTRRPAPISTRGVQPPPPQQQQQQQQYASYPSPSPLAPSPSSPLFPSPSIALPLASSQRQTSGSPAYQLGTQTPTSFTQYSQPAGASYPSPPPSASPSAGGGPASPLSPDRHDPAASASGDWFVGQMLEVKDSVGKFLPAEVLVVADGGRRIFVSFCGWSSKWDEWLEPAKDAARLRALGAALVDTTEEKAKKAAEVAFRKNIAQQHGLEIFDCDKDGNCLFRAVAHQIYGAVDRHGELRHRCYDYMTRDRAYFSTFIPEDFDSYVEKRRRDKEWGDHIEVVALREMFNKNVEIYNLEGEVVGCQPIGMDASQGSSASQYRIPVIRLSFHGGNHYNSVVDPKHPPPLGDGADSPINMRQVRQAQEAKDAADAAARAQREKEAAGAAAAAASSSASKPPTTPGKIVRSTSSGANVVSPRHAHARSNPAPPSPAALQSASRTNSTTSSSHASPIGKSATKQLGEVSSPRYRSTTLMRDTSLTKLSQRQELVSKLQLQELWATFDPKREGRMDEQYVPQLLLKVVELLHHSQRAACTAQHQLEKLSKVYHEFREAGDIDALTRDVLANVKRTQEQPSGSDPRPAVKVDFESFVSFFFPTIYDRLMWQLSR